MRAAYYNEFDPKAAAWLRELIKRELIAAGEVDERSILDVEPDDLIGFTQCHFFAGIGGWSHALRLAGWPDDQPVWTGSPPCQPFSSAGQRKGKEDERHLAPHFAHLVDARRPPILFGEQVASAAVFGRITKKAGGTAGEASEWAWIDDLQDRLEAAHYAVGVSDIPAAGVGAPHIRQRTFFGAVGLADAQRSERGSVGLSRFRETDGPEGQGEAAEPAGDCDGGWLAEPNGGQRNGITDGEERQPNGAEAGWIKGNCQPERSGADLGLADADNPGSQGRGRVFERASERPLGAHGLGGWLADADSAARRQDARGAPYDEETHGRERRYGSGPDSDHGSAGYGEDCRPCPTNGFWRDADWLFCRDGKWRPVEPGTFPLAHGVPARVVRLRGYGNAIVPQAAAAFIESFVAATQEKTHR